MQQDRENSPKQLSIWFPLLFALTLVFGMLIGVKMQSTAPTVVIDNSNQLGTGALGQGKIEELIRYIEAKYVDEVDRDELVKEAIDKILDELDPHSNYITAEQLREVNEQLEGNFDGIGVEFMVIDDTIVVVAPLAGGPAEAVGIQAGDKIVQIEDSLVVGQQASSRNIVELLRGQKGTDVTIGILRNNSPEIKSYTITRDKIPVHSVDIAYMIDEKTGYIKINRFSATTYEEFMKGLEDLVEKHKMKDLIIDLRYNPGGYLQQATNILSQLFKEKGELLVYTEGRSVSRSEYESTGRAFYDIDDIVVLIDEGSASASEILAGAIQDHDRGSVVGRRSFGKGLVQEQYKLRDGSALRLTVARYYTPAGRSIQKPYEDLKKYENDMVDRYESGELQSPDKMILGDSTTKYYTSGGRVVYGGGGIAPDFFVPLDTILLNEQYTELRQHAPQFIYRYINEHADEFSEATLENFQKDFQVTDSFYNDFLAFASAKTANLKGGTNSVVRRETKRFLKARLARHLFGDRGFYAVWNTDDQMVEKALEVLRAPNLQTAEGKN